MYPQNKKNIHVMRQLSIGSVPVWTKPSVCHSLSSWPTCALHWIFTVPI